MKCYVLKLIEENVQYIEKSYELDFLLGNLTITQYVAASFFGLSFFLVWKVVPKRESECINSLLGITSVFHPSIDVICRKH